jgi:MoxR-like ATPase
MGTSSKTLFLLELAKQKGAVFFDCTNTTSRILDVLEQERPKIILFDELEKMGKTFRNRLLGLIEGGRVKVEQMKHEYDFTIKGAKVFASANDLNKLSAPLRSRFRRLHLLKYSREQFVQIASAWAQNNADGNGATFTFSLPLREQTPSR